MLLLCSLSTLYPDTADTGDTLISVTMQIWAYRDTSTVQLLTTLSLVITPCHRIKPQISYLKYLSASSTTVKCN